MTVEKKREFIINVLYVAIIAAILFVVFKYLLIWLMPFVIGLLCALVLQRPVAFLTKKTPIPRGVWSGVLVIVLLTLAFGIIGVVGYRLYVEMLSFVKGLSGLIPSITDSVNSLSDRLSGWLATLPQGVSDTIRTLPGELASKLVGFLSGFLSTAAGAVVSGGPALILSIVISIIACCFITADYNKITRFILRQFTDDKKQIILKAKTFFTQNILKMLRGYAIILGITFVELAIGFSLMRVDYAIVIALLIALMDILPVVGTGTALIPWALFDFIAGNYVGGILILVLYAFITIVRNIIEPKIIGRQVGLPAIVTLLSMYLGLKLFGFVGLFAFPITLIIVKNLQDADMIHIWK